MVLVVLSPGAPEGSSGSGFNSISEYGAMA